MISKWVNEGWNISINMNTVLMWGMCGGYFAPTIYVGSLLKSKRSKQCKMTQTKEYSK